MDKLLPVRFLPFVACLAVFALALALAISWDSVFWRWIAAISGVLCLVGVVDISARRHTLRRNFPVTAHLRTFFEYFRPMLRQYVVESDYEEVPFSHMQRSIAYQRAKNVLDKRPFGTQLDVYATQYEWINHSLAPAHIDSHDFRIDIGGAQCSKPYSASVFNISAMSFGSLSANAIRALNEGARRGGFYHDTGEGSISPYHRENGGDICWEIGSGYFGCRSADGTFNEERFVENA
ncbi:MAG TPA: glutamate synthase-related protein, partial [Rudaea sp.]|nr:glutamate synthase-related protein [Rudaea sp.]